VNSPTAFTNTANSLVDPNCPAGQAGDPRCETQFNVRLSSDANLKPEKSRQYSFGAVFEPIRDLSIALDYWHIQKKDQIGVIGGDAIMADPTLYQRYISRVHRQPAPNSFVSYIDTPVENLGDLKTNGIDVDVKATWAPASPAATSTSGSSRTARARRSSPTRARPATARASSRCRSGSTRWASTGAWATGTCRWKTSS
jgi:iron complex outermembrane receptor protein